MLQEVEEKAQDQLNSLRRAIDALTLGKAELTRRQRLMAELLRLQEAHISDLHRDEVSWSILEGVKASPM